MGFKRAEWHSGFTYTQVCNACKTTVVYTDYELDFRPWYADGFVYCPTCKTPLRHYEKFAINNPTIVNNVPTQPPTQNKNVALFCTQCGYRFEENDKFCPMCGVKR